MPLTDLAEENRGVRMTFGDLKTPAAPDADQPLLDAASSTTGGRTRPGA